MRFERFTIRYFLASNYLLKWRTEDLAFKQHITFLVRFLALEIRMPISVLRTSKIIAKNKYELFLGNLLMID